MVAHIKALLFALAATALFAGSAARSGELVSPWSEGPLSRVRLIAATMPDGRLQAGIEISLKDGAHTYWRTPGDGGVPPVFDFSASKNLKSASVRFPVPARIDEAGLQIFGYKREVILLLDVVAADTGKPITVDLKMSYAACEKICMPSEARASLILAAPAPGGEQAQRLARYEAQTPRPLNGPDAPKISVTALKPRDGGKMRWRAIVEPAPTGTVDLFVEGPDGWIFDTRASEKGGFEIRQEEKPADSTNVPPVTVTVSTGAGAFEGVIHLDAGGSTP